MTSSRCLTSRFLTHLDVECCLGSFSSLKTSFSTNCENRISSWFYPSYRSSYITIRHATTVYNETAILSEMRNSDVASEQTFVIEFTWLYRSFHKTHQISRGFFSAHPPWNSSYLRTFGDRRDFRRHMRACTCRVHRRSISQTLNADGTGEMQFTVFPAIRPLSPGLLRILPKRRAASGGRQAAPRQMAHSKV